MDFRNKQVVILSAAVGCLFILFVVTVVIYCTMAMYPTEQSSTVGSVATPIAEDIPSDITDIRDKTEFYPSSSSSQYNGVYNLGITDSDFRQRFNYVAQTELSDLGMRLTKSYVYNGTQASVYQVPIASSASILVSSEPDTDLVKGVAVVLNSSSESDAVQFLGGIAAVVASLSPSLSPNARGNVLKELGMFSGRQNYGGSTYRGNVHYAVMKPDSGGVIFVAVAKDVSINAGSSVSRDAPHNIMADMTNYIIWDNDNQKSNANQGSRLSYNTENYNAGGNATAEASAVLTRFHALITEKNLAAAYDCLTPSFQNYLSYDGWAQGFATTVQSSVYDIKTASATSNRVVLTYYLRAEDNPGGIRNFTGTAVVIRTGNGWKLDEIVNKRI